MSEFPIERAVWFPVGGADLLGIIHESEAPSSLGLVIVVGGPQYRVGSHRQFVLLARAVAAAGFPVLRFDHRGAGDSGGAPRTFAQIEEDIKAASEYFATQTAVQRVVLWGLCDAASAILMQAHRDPRVAALILLNPWVHTAETEAHARLSTYYVARLRSAHFWSKIARFEVDWRRPLVSLVGYLRALRGRSPEAFQGQVGYIERMLAGLIAFRRPVYLVLSGQDQVANEFRSLLAGSDKWRLALHTVLAGRLELDEANHTFSEVKWRTAVEEQTVAWLQELARA